MTADRGAPVIRVVIADDHAVVRRGTRQILEGAAEAIEVVGEAGDGIEAVEIVTSHVPDVAILDIGMPRLNGVEATRQIKAAQPSVGVLMLTVQDADEYVWQAIQAGASGYLLKDVSDADLIRAVRTVAQGGALLDKAITKGVLTRLMQLEDKSNDLGGLDESLTPRELDVVRLAAQGLSNKGIGETLGISPRTVEVHMRKVFTKTGATSRTEAVVVAARRRLIDLDDGAGP